MFPEKISYPQINYSFLNPWKTPEVLKQDENSLRLFSFPLLYNAAAYAICIWMKKWPVLSRILKIVWATMSIMHFTSYIK